MKKEGPLPIVGPDTIKAASWAGDNMNDAMAQNIHQLIKKENPYLAQLLMAEAGRGEKGIHAAQIGVTVYMLLRMAAEVEDEAQR